MVVWQQIMRFLGLAERQATPRDVAALEKANAAIASLEDATQESRSLTHRLQRLYAEKGRDGFKAFVSDVNLADELSRVHHGPPR